MVNAPILKVAINVPVSRTFDYLPPAGQSGSLTGTRVEVPFGRRRQVGLVLGDTDCSEVPFDRIKRASETLDDQPLLADADLWLIRFTSDYYHHPIGEVMAAALPALLRQGRSLHPKTKRVVITDAGSQFDIEALARRAPRQAELLVALIDAGGNGIDVDTLAEQIPNWRRACRQLLEKGLASEFETDASGPAMPSRIPGEPGPELNEDQNSAVATIRNSSGFTVSVLDGVTGSGKTEVYLHLIANELDKGKQVLVLVPEIGLTPQLVSRFRARLGIEPALLHSGLSDLQRLNAWRNARSGKAKLVVGTRSAVFTPIPEAGLIIVDEEHDHSFKQQEGLRYSARDLAIARAKHLDIPIVLGSATPTLEMLQHCEAGHYQHLVLPRRAGAAQPPRVRLVDLGRAVAEEGLSEPLVDAIEEHLADDGQVLMYLNRRGFAPTLICTGCGHVAECRRCDSRMTVHSRR